MYEKTFPLTWGLEKGEGVCEVVSAGVDFVVVEFKAGEGLLGVVGILVGEGVVGFFVGKGVEVGVVVTVVLTDVVTSNLAVTVPGPFMVAVVETSLLAKAMLFESGDTQPAKAYWVPEELGIVEEINATAAFVPASYQPEPVVLP